ncbi:18568_t:CDS:1, partial [Acaulospora morrowiae]
MNNTIFLALCALDFCFWPLIVFFAPDALRGWVIHLGSVSNSLRAGLMNAIANALFQFLFPAPSSAASTAVKSPNALLRHVFLSMHSVVWFLSNVLLNPIATWNAFLFYVSFGAYVAPNTVVTTAPTPAQSRVYRAQLEFSFFISLFVISYLALLSVSYPVVAFVISCFALSAMHDITVNAAVALNFLGRLASRL